MRIALLVCALAAAALAAPVDPYLSLKVCQPWAEDIRATYRALPELELGIRSPRTRAVALAAGLSGRYADGVGENSAFRFWDVTGRIAAEFTLERTLGIYLAPGVFYKYAAERWPDHDEQHNIIYTDVGGGSIGFALHAGLELLRAGPFELKVETGMDLVSVQTDRLVKTGYWYDGSWYYWLPLSGFDLGLKLGLRGREGEQ